MNRRRRVIIRLITVTPLVAIVAAAVAYLLLQANLASGQLSVLVVDEMERLYNREVKIGKLSVESLGTVVIEDVVVAEKHELEKEPILEVPKVLLKYNWLDLALRRKPPIQTLSTVTLVSPKVRVTRLPDGTWNFSDFLVRRPGPPPKPFTGKVNVKNGDIEFRDFLAKAPGPQPAVNRLTRMQLFLDISQFPKYRFQAAGSGTGERLGDVALSGNIDAKRGIWLIDLNASNAEAGYWANYLAKPAAIRITKGKADVSASLEGRRDGKKFMWTYVGSAAVMGAEAGMNGFKKPASDISGHVRFATDLATLDMKGRFAGNGFKLGGRVFGFARPRLDIKIASSSANFTSLLDAVSLPEGVKSLKARGRGPLEVRILGPVSGPSVTVETRVPQATAHGYAASDINISAVYSGNTLQINRASGQALGGRIVVNGSISVTNPAVLSISGTASRVNVEDLPLPPNVQLKGTASGAFDVTGTAAYPKITLNVKEFNGNYNNLALSGVSGYLSASADEIEVDNLKGSTAGGSVVLGGTASLRALNLSVDVKSLDIGKISQAFGQPDFVGTLFFKGRITGNPADPMASGTAEIFEGQFRDYRFDYARGNIQASPSALRVDEAVVRILPGQGNVRGRIERTADGGLDIDLQADVERADARQIAGLLGLNADVAGMVRGTLQVRGTSPDFSVSGSVMLDDGAVAGIPVANASADVQYTGGRFELKSAVARSEGALLAASGTLEEDGKLSFTFVGSDISMSRLNPYLEPYAVLKGKINSVAGTISGTTDDPQAKVSVRASSMNINGQSFDAFSATASWNDDALTVSEVSLSHGQTVYSLENAVYDTITNSVTANGRLVRVPVEQIANTIYGSPYVKAGGSERLAKMLAGLPRPLTGEVTVGFEVNGPLDALTASVDGSATDVKIGPVDIERMDTKLMAKDGKVTIDNLSAVSEDLNISVRPGVVYSDGNMSLDFTVSNLNAALLSPYIQPMDIAGTVTVDALVTGSLDAPEVTASVEMENPVVEGIAFDRLRASQVSIGEDQITVSDIILSKGPHQMVLQGSVPWSWADLTVPNGQPIELTAELKNQNIALISAFTDAIDNVNTSGTIDASLVVSGTRDNPSVNGSLSITDGKMALKGSETSLNNIQVSLAFDGKTLTVEELSAVSSLGGTVRVEPGGTVSIAGMDGGEVDLSLVADAFHLKEKGMSGYNESVTATLDSTIKVTGNLKSPLVAGAVDVKDAIVIVPPVIPAESKLARTYLINPKFDVKIDVGDNVWFRNPRLVAETQGSASLRGTLASPDFRGTLSVADGYIRLPTARLQLVKGGTVEIEYSSTADTIGAEVLKTDVNVSAKTSVTALSPLNVRRQYQITLTAKGPVDNLNISLVSSPADLSRNRMLALLGHVEDIFLPGDVALKQDLSQVFTAVAGSAVLAPIETAVVEALGLEGFRVELGQGAPVAIYASTELFPDLSVSYWRTLNAITDSYFLKFTYNFKDDYALSYSMDDRSISTLEAQLLFRF